MSWLIATVVVVVVALTAEVVRAGDHTPRLHPLPTRPGPIDASPSAHLDNWAVIVSTSRFWHNYRHTANALAVYRMARDSGIPDSHIILMLADDHACDPRNPLPGTIHATKNMQSNLYCADIEVDYAGDAVTAVTFLRVLTGRVPAGSPSIHPGPSSNVLVYLTGHSGEHFMKFHDYDFMTSYDLSEAFHTMHLLRRYHRAFLVLDTCQAETLFTYITAPNVLALASSREYENSISHTQHAVIGLTAGLIDGFTGEWRDAWWRTFASRAVSHGGGDHVATFPCFVVPPTEGLLQFFDQHIDPARARSHHVSNVDRLPELRSAVLAHWKLIDFFGPGVSAFDQGWSFG